MSLPDSRKAFLTKICVCLAAVGFLPGFLRRRQASEVTTTGNAAPGFPVKPDQRAIRRENGDL